MASAAGATGAAATRVPAGAPGSAPGGAPKQPSLPSQPNPLAGVPRFPAPTPEQKNANEALLDFLFRSPRVDRHLEHAYDGVSPRAVCFSALPLLGRLPVLEAKEHGTGGLGGRHPLLALVYTFCSLLVSLRSQASLEAFLIALDSLLSHLRSGFPRWQRVPLLLHYLAGGTQFITMPFVCGKAGRMCG